MFQNTRNVIGGFLKKAMLATSLVAAIGLVGCDDDEDCDPCQECPTQDTRVTIGGSVVGGDTLTLDATKVYRLVGTLQVLDGGVLEVPAGTRIEGAYGTNPIILVLTGGKIDAQGTEQKPIVFTSEKAAGQRSRSDIGGIVLNGLAPNNGAGGQLEGEGNTGTHGGTDPMDNSGVLKYVRVEFGGTVIATDNEINGFTFNSVGAGTTLEHLQAHYIADDGFEWFGGTVNSKYLVSSGNDDDCFDTDYGFIGKGQFWCAVQASDKANRLYESDNNAAGDGSKTSLDSLTHPTVYNATLIGKGAAIGETDGMYIRRNAQGSYFNHIVANVPGYGMVIDGSASQNNFNTGHIFLNKAVFYVKATTTTLGDANWGAFKGGVVASGYDASYVTAKTTAFGVQVANPNFTSVDFANPVNGTLPNPVPTAAFSGATPTDFARFAGDPTNFFDATATYIGAFGSTNWMSSWTTWAKN